MGLRLLLLSLQLLLPRQPLLVAAVLRRTGLGCLRTMRVRGLGFAALPGGPRVGVA